jgi:hypothetical protein
VLDRVNRRDKFSMKKPLRSAARGASFHTKHASNANVVRVISLDANSYLALREDYVGIARYKSKLNHKNDELKLNFAQY